MSKDRYGFEIGTEVAIFSDDGWYRNGHVKITRIEKYHKNGNFVVEGSPQQWTPHSKNHASQTGTGYYRSTLKKLTPEVRVEAEKVQRAQRWRRAVSDLEKIDATSVTDEMLAGLQAVLAIQRKKTEQ